MSDPEPTPKAGKPGKPGDVLRAYLTRWRPQQALAKGWARVLAPGLRRAALLPVALTIVPVVVLVCIALVDHAWVSRPSGPIRWAEHPLRDPLRLVLLAAALFVAQLAIAQIGRALLRDARGTDDALAARRLPALILPALLLGTLPKLVAAGLAIIVLHLFPPVPGRNDLVFMVCALPWLMLESRLAFWHLVLHDATADARGLRSLWRRGWQLTSYSWGRVFVMHCIVGAAQLMVVWCVALMAARQPDLALIWLAIGLLPLGVLWLWLAAAVAWVHETERIGPAGTIRPGKPGPPPAPTA
ncbi:MAG: hypothetical protein AB7K09_13620 [Planctomycetota bacterium]